MPWTAFLQKRACVCANHRADGRTEYNIHAESLSNLVCRDFTFFGAVNVDHSGLGNGFARQSFLYDIQRLRDRLLLGSHLCERLNSAALQIQDGLDVECRSQQAFRTSDTPTPVQKLECLNDE